MHASAAAASLHDSAVTFAASAGAVPATQAGSWDYAVLGAANTRNSCIALASTLWTRWCVLSFQML